MKKYDSRKITEPVDVCECGHMESDHGILDSSQNECLNCMCPEYKKELTCTFDEYFTKKIPELMKNDSGKDVLSKKIKKEKIETNLESVKLLEAYTRDVGRGVCRIDYDTMDQLKIKTGAVVMVKGINNCVFKVLPLYPSDEGKNMIRVDGLGREELGVKIGTPVSIKTVDSNPCIEYTVAPLEAIPPIDERYLSDALEGNPVQVGQKVMVPYFGGRLVFIIKDVNPEGAVVIHENSKCTIIDRKDFTEYYDFKESLDEERKDMILKLKKSIDEKKPKDILKIIDEISEFDLLNTRIKDLLSDKITKHQIKFKTPIHEALEEALKKCASSKKGNDE